jgi:hypothetical protein
MGFVTDALFGSAPTISAPEKRSYLAEMQSALECTSRYSRSIIRSRKAIYTSIPRTSETSP